MGNVTLCGSDLSDLATGSSIELSDSDQYFGDQVETSLSLQGSLPNQTSSLLRLFPLLLCLAQQLDSR